MIEELTTEYNMTNWREATKGWIFGTYSLEKYGEIPGTLYIGDSSFQQEEYGRDDFERDLRKVSQKIKR